MTMDFTVLVELLLAEYIFGRYVSSFYHVERVSEEPWE